MSANTTPLQGAVLEQARELLLVVARALDRAGLHWHLEGGTLLGIVRDGDLLAWDTDMDVSVQADDAPHLLEALREALPWSRWRLAPRRFTADGPAWKRGQLRLLKVASRRFGLFDGALRLDVFVKYRADGHAWWQAEEKVMRVPEAHYAAHDAIAWRGATLRAPRDHARYLALKYGDWRTPVRDWRAGRDEKTIVGDV
jgi:lipopolysaccharide cholinephosphotransferase